MRSVSFFLAVIAGVIFVSGPVRAAELKTAIFAGGCFWCVESDFDQVEGVKETVSGYIGGTRENPTYQDHVESGFKEAVEIKFDPDAVSYAELLKIFFRSVDPTDGSGQFCDRGASYSTAIYTMDETQKTEAEAAMQTAASELDRRLATEIIPAPTFWPAEGYHQNYYVENPLRYKVYRYRCGRDKRIENLWGDQAMYGIKH